MKIEVVLLLCSLSQVISAPYYDDRRGRSCRYKRPRYCRISGRRLDKILKNECRYVAAQSDICLSFTTEQLTSHRLLIFGRIVALKGSIWSIRLDQDTIFIGSSQIVIEFIQERSESTWWSWCEQHSTKLITVLICPTLLSRYFS